MKSVSAQKAVDSTLDIIKKRTGAYAELAEKFGPLFLEKARLRDELITSEMVVPTIDTARLSSGVPILVDEDFSQWAESMQQAVSQLLPVLSGVLDLPEDSWRSLQEYLSDPDNLSGLVQARIEGNWKHYENISAQLGIAPYTTLLYISETVFAPVLCAMADSWGEPLTSLAWDQGYCPVCGSTPSISLLSPKDVTDLDQLVGGGGKKYLHCSLCGHDWRFKRNACAACGNDENESREVFYIDEVQYERIEACHKCGKYCLNIDMRECEPHPHLDTVQLGLIHLDILARGKQLSPISPTLWNGLE